MGRFCAECGSLMNKSTLATGSIVFQCRCQLTSPGLPDDTLMSEGYFESADSNMKHDVFIENSPFDEAGHKVRKECQQCGLNFMTMIRVGQNETTMYTCTCGNVVSLADYMKSIHEDKEPKEPKKSKVVSPEIS
jgi:DNA-directed RNA polymerase subunit M/transcription elongation factor TFIIS